MSQPPKVPRLDEDISSQSSSESDVELDIGALSMPDSSAASLDVGSLSVSKLGVVPGDLVSEPVQQHTDRHYQEVSVRGIPVPQTSVLGTSQPAGSSKPDHHDLQVSREIEVHCETDPHQLDEVYSDQAMDSVSSLPPTSPIGPALPPLHSADEIQMDSGWGISEEVVSADLYQEEEEESDSIPTPDQHSFSFSADEDEDAGDSDSSLMDENVIGFIPNLPPDNLLYSQSPLTVEESLLSIISFAQSENLTGVGISKLLRLIELHCPKPNKCLSSYEQILTHFKNVKTPMKSYFYCSKCLKERSSLTDKCDRDSCIVGYPIDQVIVLSIVDQLSELYSRPGFLSDIQYRFQRVKTNPENLEDIYDGNIYKELVQASILSDNHNVSLMWNIDGVSPQDSSDLQIWPCYAVPIELSPEKRFKRENTILIGVFVGHSKPHPNIFFKNIYPEVKKMNEGFEVDVPDQPEPLVVHGVFLCGTCDSPARAAIFNMKLFNGHYSCPKCLSKGEMSEASDNVFVHPYEEDCTLRTEESYEQDAQLAVLSNANKPESQRVSPHGIKGTTFLYLMVCSMIRSTAIDTMHCLYLGVMKQFLELWFSKAHKAKDFSLFNVKKVVNHRILSIQPPAFVKRMPRHLGHLAKFKAYELMLMLFFYLLPALNGIMMQDYFHNFKLLVSGVSCLNKSSVSLSDIQSAKILLTQFVKDFQDLYGLRNMSYNIHLVLHLPLVTEELGPTQHSSCFGFENLNGILCRLIHGNRYVGSQIASKLFMFLHLPQLVGKLAAGNVKDYCIQVHKKWKRLRLIEIN